MKQKSRILAFLLIIYMVFSAAPQNAFAKGESGAHRATGLRAPTQGETDFFNEKAKNVKKVLPNAEGLKRINSARAQKGLRPLSQTLAASDGEDIISTTDSSRSEKKYAAALKSYGEINDVLPAAVDLSMDSHFPAIGDQGSLGSCASFATTYYAATYETAAQRNISLVDNPNRILSPKFNYNLNNNGANNGSSIFGNLATLYTRGAPFIDEASMTAYQYDGSGSDPLQYLEYPQTADIYNDALKNRIAGFGSLSDVNTAEGLEQIKQMINNSHVLVMGTAYKYDWLEDKPIKDDPSTSADDAYAGQYACYGMSVSNPAVTSGHAMTIVGYNDDLWVDIDGDNAVDDFEKGALKVANSWGTGWGNGGTIWLSYNGLQDANGHTGVIDNNMVFYITAQDEYTPKATAEITVTTAHRNQLWLYSGVNWNEAAQGNIAYTDYVFYKHGDDTNKYYWGGDYSFAGTTTETQATVVIDLTDAIDAQNLSNAGGKISLCAIAQDNKNDAYSQRVDSVVFKTDTSITALDTVPVSLNYAYHWFCGKGAITGNDPPAYDETVEQLAPITLGTVKTAASTGPGDVKEYYFVPAVTGSYIFKNNTANTAVGLEIQNGARKSLYTGSSTITVPLYAGKSYVLRSWNKISGLPDLETVITLKTQWASSAASAKLSALSVSAGESLSPAFNADTYNYTAQVHDDVTLTAAAQDPSAYVVNGGKAGLVQDYALQEGVPKTARIEVTSKDWLYTNVYKVVLTRLNYTVNFMSNGGTSIPQQKVKRGGLVTQPEKPVRNGYLFDGWYADEALSVPFAFESCRVYADTTLYAKWKYVPPVGFTFQKTDVSLYGKSDGKITVSATGGLSGNYRYSVNGGAIWKDTGYFDGLAAGTYAVMVSDADDPNNLYIQTVTINQPNFAGSYTASKTPARADAGSAITIEPSPAPKNYSMQSVDYTTSNKLIAVTDGNGNITFLKGGKVRITITMVYKKTDASGKVTTKKKKVVKTITVKELVSSIALNASDKTLAVKKSFKLAARVGPSSATNKKVSWKSSNSKVATVSRSGVVKAKAPGSCVITCTARDGSGKTAVCTITVS